MDGGAGSRARPVQVGRAGAGLAWLAATGPTAACSGIALVRRPLAAAPRHAADSAAVRPPPLPWRLRRRVPDYYELGAAWGHGATCTVCECVGRYNGQRYALKSRLHKSRGATEAMHNELRILQICAKKP